MATLLDHVVGVIDGLYDTFSHSTRLLAATTLRNVLGTRNLAEILSERESISKVTITKVQNLTKKSLLHFTKDAFLFQHLHRYHDHQGWDSLIRSSLIHSFAHFAQIK